MKQIMLPRGKQATSNIGFGCAYLSGGMETAKSARLVAAALDCGIRHFDVAPSYGMGTAEDALGKALSGRRHEITIATKAGIARPRIRSGVMLARSIAAPLRKLIPQLTRKIGTAVRSNNTARGNFDPAFVKASLHESLRRLRTDYVDLFLLHEAQPADITDELLTTLDKLRRDGTALAVGVASSYENDAQIAGRHGAFFDVCQYSWNALEHAKTAPAGAKFVITHRALLDAY